MASALDRNLTLRKSAQIVSCTLALLMLLSTTGCIKRIWLRDDDAQQRMQNAPLIMLEKNDTHHLIVMQAPSPGWSIRLDATERTPTGKRVFVTLRRPDPAYEYPQQIVQMHVLTSVRLDSKIVIVGRLLEHDEKTKGKGYAPVTPVESFD